MTQNQEERQSDSPENHVALPDRSASPMVLKYFLLFFLISIIALARLLWPFLSILVLSFLLTSIFRPVYNYLLSKLSSRSAASILTCILIILLVFIPLLFLVGALSKEAFGLYQMVKGTNWGVKIQELILGNATVLQLKEGLAGLGVNFDPESLSRALAEFAKTAGFFLYNHASTWAANLFQFAFSFFMMIIVIFFLLIDHARLIAYMVRLSPLPDDQERQLITKFEEIAGAVLIGNGICGLIQGVLGGVVFAFFSLGQPILWGGIMAILAFLPILGIGLVLMPAALILFIKGRVAAAIFFFVFYMVLSFSVEYLLKPKLVGEQVKMHTLLIFLAIMGGLSAFGVLGIIFGPLIVTAFLTLSDIYLESYDKYIRTG